MNLNNKNILLSGSSGFLGPVIKDSLERLGASVIAIDENTVDISNPKCVEGFFKSLNIGLDGLVNNSGISYKGKHIGNKEFVKTIMVNSFGTYKMLDESIKVLKDGSSVVNVSSVYGSIVPDYSIYSGNEEQFNNVSYGGTKAFVNQITKIYAVQYAHRNIRVNAVSPGGIYSGQDKNFIKKYSRRSPLDRMVTPQEVSNCIAFLLSDFSSGITGQNIFVDAGLSAQ